MTRETMTAYDAAKLVEIMPACPTEDSNWCGWNAAAQGNGQGRSFLSFGNLIIQ